MFAFLVDRPGKWDSNMVKIVGISTRVDPKATEAPDGSAGTQAPPAGGDGR
jgi:hypothetical protein